MTEGKDIVDISAAFVAGIVSGSLILRHTDAVFFFAASAAFLLAVTLFTIIRHSIRRMGGIQFLLFLTGFFCYCTGKISAPFAASPDLLHFTHGAAEKISNIISEIPFGQSDSNALVKALVLGDRSDLDKGIVDAFRASGAAHILALSGLHLGIIYMVVSKLLTIFGRSPVIRSLRAFLLISVSAIYVSATGASPSLMRAFLFILIHEISLLVHRKTRLDRVLCSALFIQLVFNPLAIEEIGFQLSYLAMAGICWIHPHLKKQDLSSPILQKIWDLSSLTLSCQVFTAPAVLYYFGTFPTFFLLTNLLALPLTNLIMVLSILLIALGSIKIFPITITAVGNDIIQVLIKIMEIISSM